MALALQIGNKVYIKANVMVRPLLLPFLSPSTSDSIQPCPLAFCLLCANSKTYLHSYATSTVGLASD